LNGEAATMGAWSHSTSGKASIFSTNHIGNPKPITENASAYSTAKTIK